MSTELFMSLILELIKIITNQCPNQEVDTIIITNVNTINTDFVITNSIMVNYSYSMGKSRGSRPLNSIELYSSIYGHDSKAMLFT